MCRISIKSSKNLLYLLGQLYAIDIDVIFTQSPETNKLVLKRLAFIVRNIPKGCRCYRVSGLQSASFLFRCFMDRPCTRDHTQGIVTGNILP